MKLSNITNFFGVTNTKANEPVAPEKPAFSPEQEGERKVLLEWDTLARTHLSATNGNFRLNRTLMVIGVVVAVVLAAMGEFLLIAVVASIIFIRHILSATPAEKVHHRITNHGVDYAGQFYSWSELSRYFFSSADGAETLCIDTVEKLPGRLFLLLNAGQKSQVQELVGRYLPFLQEEPKTFMDRMYESALGRLSTEAPETDHSTVRTAPPTERIATPPATPPVSEEPSSPPRPAQALRPEQPLPTEQNPVS